MDIYQTVTDQIIASIEAGADKWVMPWHCKVGADSPLPFNVSSRKAYRGVNTLMLWAAAQGNAYASNAWGTYKQWAEKGAQVRKGEKATMIVFWKFSEKVTGSTPDGDDIIHASAMARAYPVFNAGQVEGYEAPAAVPTPEVERIANAEAFFAALGADIRHGGGRAYFSPSSDHIQMPDAAAFRDMVSYYSTLAHESTHWTGVEKRCNRTMGKRFGDEAYAAEELVAELGAAFTCATLGLTSEPRADHAQYIANWLKVLKNDKRAIFTASSYAQKAMDYLMSKQESDEAEYAIAA